MQLTKMQAEEFRKVDAALQQRQPVLLTGKSDGKTTLVHKALEVLARRDEKTGGYSSTPAHAENSTIDFFPRIYLNNTTGVPQVMRQILTQAGIKTEFRLADVIVQFDKFLSKAADAGRIVCLAVDNAEMLSARSYTVLKALNEYHDPVRRRQIGCGLLVAGELSKLKRMPVNFMQRCMEVTIGKLTQSDIAELINILYPGQLRWFDERAILAMTKCRTTLEAKSVIDRSIRDKRQYRLAIVGSDLIEEKLTDIATSERAFAKAA